MADAVAPDWIAVDWGTTNLRAYAMGADGEVLATAQGSGMGQLADGGAPAFDAALRAAVEPWLGAGSIRVLMCGMVGARQGWIEAPYLPVPVALDRLGDAVVTVESSDPRLHVRLVPGLSQRGPFNVMRGEETQLAGLVALDPVGGRAERIVCLPGTHSKWAYLRGSTLERFETALTGELFDLLATQSILRHSVSDGALDEVAFGDAVIEAHGAGEKLLQTLFSIRAEGLLAGDNPARARGRLSGLLIGTELSAAGVGAGQTVELIGSAKLAAAYARACDLLGVPTALHDGGDLVRHGLASIFAQQTQLAGAVL
ncbi:MAG: 2-dehydro-3-deoxygalactonokinase [Devosiaceae bacterium]|nr:2-dehydro-3-deoxygalactonokinase [Devosiaceae bacterium MH13]